MTERELRWTGRRKLIAMILESETEIAHMEKENMKRVQSLQLSLLQEQKNSAEKETENEKLRSAVAVLEEKLREMEQELERTTAEHREEKEQLKHAVEVMERATQRIEASEQELQEKLEQTRKAVTDMTEAGSIAEALMIANGTVQSVQDVADAYLEQITEMSRNKDELLKKREEESARRAARMVEDAKIASARIRREADEYERQIRNRVQRLEDETSPTGSLFKLLKIHVSDLASDPDSDVG